MLGKGGFKLMVWCGESLKERLVGGVIMKKGFSENKFEIK